MTREQLAKILMEISEQEGGRVSVEEQNGTISFNGFNQTTYTNWLKKKGLPSKDVRGITVGESLDLMEEEFANVRGIDLLPDGVQSIVLDMAFNSGPDDAAMSVQRVVGAKEDGFIGPKTMKKFEEFQKKGDFINSFSDVRREFLMDSQKPSVVRDRDGLLNRVENVRQRELQKRAIGSVTTK